MNIVEQMKQVKTRLLTRWKANHTQPVPVRSLNNQSTMYLQGVQGVKYPVGTKVTSIYNNKHFIAEVIEHSQVIEQVDINNMLPLTGIIDSSSYDKYWERLSEVACRLEKSIHDQEEAEFSQQVTEFFHVTEDEKKDFGLK